ncbi:MAG: hemerythrin [Proteobacteria bacterium]|nr:hemerythrin [Pseudomonadota bacterium]
MTTSSFDKYLMADHRACDQQLGALRKQAGAGDWAAARSSSQALQHDVLAHFAAEEDVLFPAFEASTGMRGGPTQVMRMEHEEARLLLEDLLAAVFGQDADGVRGHGEALLILLQQHNMKEENILYPTALAYAGSSAPELTAQIIQRREAV